MSKTLYACFQSNVAGKRRLCLSGWCGGLFVPSHLENDKIAPLVAYLIYSTNGHDFDRESESVDIEPVIEIVTLILSNDLATCRAIFIKGETGFDTLLKVSRDEQQSVKTLNEANLERMVGVSYSNLRI